MNKSFVLALFKQYESDLYRQFEYILDTTIENSFSEHQKTQFLDYLMNIFLNFLTNYLNSLQINSGNFKNQLLPTYYQNYDFCYNNILPFFTSNSMLFDYKYQQLINPIFAQNFIVQPFSMLQNDQELIRNKKSSKTRRKKNKSNKKQQEDDQEKQQYEEKHEDEQQNEPEYRFNLRSEIIKIKEKKKFKTINVTDHFNGISIEKNIRVFLTQGIYNQIEADVEDISSINTIIKNRILYISLKEKPQELINIFITLTTLDLRLYGEIFCIDLPGSENARFKGKINKLNIRSSGYSKLKGINLEVDKAKLKLSGNAEVQITVNEELGYELSGHSKLELGYKSNPTIYKSITNGLTSVRKCIF